MAVSSSRSSASPRRSHDGFAGGAIIDASGRVIGVGTAAQIRGLAVVIPAAIAWKSIAHVLEHGAADRISRRVRTSGPTARAAARHSGRDRGLLVVGVTPEGPADSSGVLVGDVILDLDNQPVGSTDDFLSLLTSDRVGRTVPLRVLRGGALSEITVTIKERRT